jgi:hypothetical protein
MEINKMVSGSRSRQSIIGILAVMIISLKKSDFIRLLSALIRVEGCL